MKKDKYIYELNRAIGKKYGQNVVVSFRQGTQGEGTENEIIIESSDISNIYNKKRGWRWGIFLQPNGKWKIS